MAEPRTDEAWVTLATNDSYALGAMVLAQSLRRVSTNRQLVVMITPGISPPMRSVLESLFNQVIEVNILDSGDAANLALLTRPDLGITFTKLHCWRLTQYTKCVFLDADVLVLQNSDELFDREEFSAAPDAGWPDCFNSGVFVYRPSMDTYTKLLAFALEVGSFDGGDQGLLNLYFKDWATSDISRHLPFLYNMISSAIYSYLPAYRQFAANVKIAHFIGAVKPWLQYFDSGVGQVRSPPGQEHQTELLQAWWDIFRGEIHPRLTPEMGYGKDELSATVMEQVYFYSPETSTASISSEQTHSNPTTNIPGHYYPSPSPVQAYSQASTSEYFQSPPPPPEPELLVAIYRFTPDYIANPPPERQPEVPESQEYHFSGDYHESSHKEDARSPEPPSHGQIHTKNNPTATFNSSSPTKSNPVQGSNSSNPSTQSKNPSVLPQTNPNPNSSQKFPLEDSSKGLAGAYSKMTFDGAKSNEQILYEDEVRRSAWEQGNIDYLGKDSFDNILKKIQASMAQSTRGKSPSPPKSATTVAETQPSQAPVLESAPQQPVSAPEVPPSAPPSTPQEPAAAPIPPVSEVPSSQQPPAVQQQAVAQPSSVPQAPVQEQVAQPPSEQAAPVQQAPPTSAPVQQQAPPASASVQQQTPPTAQQQPPVVSPAQVQAPKVPSSPPAGEQAPPQAAATAEKPATPPSSPTKKQAPEPPSTPTAEEGAAGGGKPGQPKAPPRKSSKALNYGTVVGLGVLSVALAIGSYFYRP